MSYETESNHWRPPVDLRGELSAAELHSFLLGAVARIGQRLDARRAEAAEAAENGRALVLVKTAVDREIERRWPALESSGYHRASVARGAYEAGSHAGKHIDLGDRRLGPRSPALPEAAAG